jgi:replicative DNA helicase
MLQPHHNRQAEEDILGAILLSCAEGHNKILGKCNLEPEDFFDIKHRHIYQAMLSLDRNGEVITVAGLKDKISSDEMGIIIQIVHTSFTSANFKYHVGIIKENARKNRIQLLCTETIERLQDGEYGRSEEAITALSIETTRILKSGVSKIQGIHEVAKETLDSIEKRYKKEELFSGVPTGINQLDLLTDGFQEGDFIVLAGRPSKGKSALAMSINCHAAEQNFKCGFISLEMGPFQLGVRSLSSLSQIDMWRLRKGQLSREQWDALSLAAVRMANLPISFSFSTNEIHDIRRVITQMVEIDEVEFITLDYLQLAQSTDIRRREREIAAISTMLKQTAQTFRIPILCLSQLSRKVEDRDGGKPTLSDLRDSGQIEQDADVVIFMYTSLDNDDHSVIDVAKGRNIGTGRFEVYWDKEKMTFRNLS